MLRVNMASLDRQTCDDWQQTFLVDEIGRGVAWANRNLGNYAPHLEGDYIWILDDDDECTCDTFVADMKRIARQHDPDVIMVRTDVHGHGILPENDYWMQPPAMTHVAMSGFVVRRPVWQRWAGAFPERLGGDHAFIAVAYHNTAPDKVYWHDAVVMRTQQVSRGKPE